MKPVIQKQPAYRNRKLLDISHESPSCFLRIPGVCIGSPCVPAHSNYQRHGRGVSHKAHDCFVVAACNACHAWLDSGKASREEKDNAFTHGLNSYTVWLWTEGKVKVA